MNEDQFLDLKIEKLKKLLKLDDLLIEAMEKEDMDSIASFMEEKFMVINEIKAIDKKLKEKKREKVFAEQSEQREQKFRYIKQVLNRLKNKEERLLYMACEKMEHLEKELKQINEALKIKKSIKKDERKKVFLKG